MTRYWLKIALGALLVFAVGMLIWTGVRKGTQTAQMVFNSAEPITIPLKFVNFRVDGASLGRLQQVKLLRAAPESIEGVEVTVRLDSAALVERLQQCAMRLDDFEQMNERTTFVCVHAESVATAVGVQQFGRVLVQGTEVSMPLLLPTSVVQEFRNHDGAGADSLAPPAPPAVPGAEPVAAPSGASAAAGQAPPP